ncbi:hypothetical protein M9435_006755 [Picochlorum sp. BPE23]|nr:hypothetical protein M9435_006755 [Picochlorum sp. BPE23]
MVVHPMWYAWDQSIRSSLHKIKQEHSILGVSLTPLVKDELHFPFKDWDINALGSVYLHQVPSSWAPVFSCQAWASFRSNYALHRMNKVFEYDHNEGGTTMEGSHAGDPNFDIAGLHSNWWSNSWKRYMVEYALMTGKFFVYPNFPELQGVAKMAHVDSGEHIFTKNSPFQSDLHANPMQLIALEKNLAAFDLNFNPIRLNDAIEVGVRFQNHLHAKGGPYSQLVELLGHSNEEYSPRKFFMYAPEFGLNNQIVTLAIAVKLSTVLNRTLIIPHIFCPRREQTSVAMDDSYLEITEFLDISRALEKYKLKYVILTRGNLEYYRPNNIIELEQQSMFDSRKEIYFSGLRRYSIPRQDFMDHVTNISDKIIFVDNLYFGNVFFDQEELSDIRRNLLKPNTRLSRIQRMIEQQLSLYPKVCIHLRFTDFEKVCSSFMTTVNPFYKRMREDGFSCMPSDHQIQSLIEESLVRGKTFLMTDDPNRLNGILRGVPRKSLVTSEDIQHELERILIHATKHKLSAFQSFVEQQICKRANLAILNRLSTFSISIDILRNHSGVVWQGEDLFKNHQMLLP